MDTLNATLGQLQILNKDGDTLVQWDSQDPDSVKNAQSAFNEMSAQGYTAFVVDSKGVTTKAVLSKFDPSVERIIMVPSVQGGYPTGELENA